MKAAVVFCVEETRGNHDFYVKVDGEVYFLFRQPWKAGVNEFFKNRVRLDKRFKGAIKHRDYAVLKTFEKLPSHIKYIEKEYDIAILEKTKKAMA